MAFCRVSYVKSYAYIIIAQIVPMDSSAKHNVRLYGKWLFIWLWLVMSLMLSYFVLSFFPRDILDEIWDRIESVPKTFPTYSIKSSALYSCFVLLYVPCFRMICLQNLLCIPDSVNYNLKQ